MRRSGGMCVSTKGHIQCRMCRKQCRSPRLRISQPCSKNTKPIHWTQAVSYPRNVRPCWLVLCIILTGPQDAQIHGEALVLSMSVRVFPEEISIWISGLRNADMVGISPFREGLNRTRRPGRLHFSLPICWSWEINLLPSGLLVFRPSDLAWGLHHQRSGSQASTLHHCSSCVSSVQIEDYGTSHWPD